MKYTETKFGKLIMNLNIDNLSITQQISNNIKFLSLYHFKQQGKWWNKPINKNNKTMSQSHNLNHFSLRSKNHALHAQALAVTRNIE